jgi:hypothetical protein
MTFDLLPYWLYLIGSLFFVAGTVVAMIQKVSA